MNFYLHVDTWLEKKDENSYHFDFQDYLIAQYIKSQYFILFTN